MRNTIEKNRNFIAENRPENIYHFTSAEKCIESYNFCKPSQVRETFNVNKNKKNILFKSNLINLHSNSSININNQTNSNFKNIKNTLIEKFSNITKDLENCHFSYSKKLKN